MRAWSSLDIAQWRCVARQGEDQAGCITGGEDLKRVLSMIPYMLCREVASHRLCSPGKEGREEGRRQGLAAPRSCRPRFRRVVTMRFPGQARHHRGPRHRRGIQDNAIKRGQTWEEDRNKSLDEDRREQERQEETKPPPVPAKILASPGVGALEGPPPWVWPGKWQGSVPVTPRAYSDV